MASSRAPTTQATHAAPNDALARTAGRGGLAVSAAKLYFLLIGLVQQIALKAILGLDSYGALSSALSAASIAYNPLVSASLQGVSRAVATADDSQRGPRLRGALRLHAGLAIGTSVAFFFLSPTLGALTGAPHIVPALRWLSATLLVYGLYAPLVGALNGSTRFTAQAGLDTLAATLRTLGLLGGAWLLSDFTGGPVSGAALGFVLSSALVLGVASRVQRVPSRSPNSTQPFNRGRYLRFVGPIVLSQLLLNLLFQSDQLLLRRFAASAAVTSGLSSEAADPLVGAYRAVQLFCFLPYQLVLAIGIVLFPLLAKAQEAGDRERVKQWVQVATRLALLVAGSIVCVTASLPEALLTLVFGRDTAALGAPAMLWLAPGLSSLALLGLLIAILNSLRAPRLALAVTASAVVAVVSLASLTVRGQPFAPELLVRTAVATSSSLAFATVAAGALVWRLTGAALVPQSAARIGGCLVVTVAAGRQLPIPSRLLTLPLCLGLVLVFVFLLIATRELDRKDWGQLRALLGRGAQGSGG